MAILSLILNHNSYENIILELSRCIVYLGNALNYFNLLNAKKSI